MPVAATMEPANPAVHLVLSLRLAREHHGRHG